MGAVNLRDGNRSGFYRPVSTRYAPRWMLTHVGIYCSDLSPYRPDVGVGTPSHTDIFPSVANECYKRGRVKLITLIKLNLI
jgi:hypothetical protein